MEVKMPSLISRRMFAGTLALSPVVTSLAARAQAQSDPAAQLAELERKSGGRLGVSILNVATGKRIGHRAGERFLMCSTFKALLAAHILARVDRKEDGLDRRIVYTKADLLPHAPITEKHVGGNGLSLAELCEAIVTLSDNPAANLLLASSGGPAGLTAFLRSIGDPVSRLDRTELDLNEYAAPGDPRDTSTPAAMLDTLRKLVLGNVLSRPSRAQLAAWLVANKTGDARLRAGFPANWLVGDKTGTGSNKTGYAHDVAAAWSPDRGAVLVTCYCEMPGLSPEQRNAVHAAVGSIAAHVM
jgi:beta-lactamase class A